MNIVVMSDTHMNIIEQLPINLINDIKTADAVIHAGDMVTEIFFESLNKISKKLYAVKGNNDFFAKIPEKISFRIENINISLIHGDGAYWRNIEDYLLEQFTKEKPDIIIFGHTHNPNLTKINSTIILNPGSVSSNRYLNYNSYVKLFIEDKKFEVNFIKT